MKRNISDAPKYDFCWYCGVVIERNDIPACPAHSYMRYKMECAYWSNGRIRFQYIPAGHGKFLTKKTIIKGLLPNPKINY